MSQSKKFPSAGYESTALLVHSDLRVVDDDLNVIHGSMISYMALDAHIAEPFSYFLSRNFVTGCATACNRRLLV